MTSVKGIKNMEFMRNLALANNAELLCKEWITNSTKYSFKLDTGQIVWFPCSRLALLGWPKDPSIPHKGRYVPANIVRDRRIVANKKRLDALKLAAAAEGYTLLSADFELKESSYLLKNSNFLFKDRDGNEVTKTFRSIIPYWRSDRIKEVKVRSGTSMAEFICRQAISHLLNSSFPTTRQVLTKEVVNRSHNLELDGYCDRLKVAFEYQGFPSHWKKTHPKHEATTAKDLIKKQACKKLGITLVEIPPLNSSKIWDPSYVITEVSSHLKKAFKENNRRLPTLTVSGFSIDFNNDVEKHLSYIREMADLATENGGQFLDSEWKGYEAPYRFIDANGVEFTRTYHTIKQDGWRKSNRISTARGGHLFPLAYLEEMRSLAESNGCTMVSTEYVPGCSGKLEFENSKGIRFTTTKKSVMEKGWPAKHCTPGTPGFEEANEIRRVRNIARRLARKLAIKNTLMQSSATMH